MIITVHSNDGEMRWVRLSARHSVWQTDVRHPRNIHLRTVHVMNVFQI